jgi:hypothetical protein
MRRKARVVPVEKRSAPPVQRTPVQMPASGERRPQQSTRPFGHFLRHRMTDIDERPWPRRTLRGGGNDDDRHRPDSHNSADPWLKHVFTQPESKSDLVATTASGAKRSFAQTTRSEKCQSRRSDRPRVTSDLHPMNGHHHMSVGMSQKCQELIFAR